MKTPFLQQLLLISMAATTLLAWHSVAAADEALKTHVISTNTDEKTPPSCGQWGLQRTDGDHVKIAFSNAEKSHYYYAIAFPRHPGFMKSLSQKLKKAKAVQFSKSTKSFSIPDGSRFLLLVNSEKKVRVWSAKNKQYQIVPTKQKVDANIIITPSAADRGVTSDSTGSTDGDDPKQKVKTNSYCLAKIVDD